MTGEEKNSRTRHTFSRQTLVYIYLRRSGEDRNSKLLVNHEGEDTHLSGTSLVELDSTLLKLGLSIESVPSEVNEVVTEVTNEFSSGDVLHDSNLKEADKGDDLGDTSLGDGVQGLESTGNVGELGSIVGDVSGKTNSGFSDEVSSNGKHANTSVLDLDETKTVELGLITIGDKSKRIIESKRRLGTELVLESIKSGGLGSLLSGSESGGGGNKGGKDGRLHVCFLEKENEVLFARLDRGAGSFACFFNSRFSSHA